MKQPTLNNFLKLAKCPKCKGKLIEKADGVKCQLCNDIYFYNSDGILLFYPRKKDEKITDKYEEPNFVEWYTGILAFGNEVLGKGQMESLHRTVSQLVLSTAIKKPPTFILDIGCGVGRATSDCATYLGDSFVVGLDLSERKLSMAKKIVQGKENIRLALAHFGFHGTKIKGHGLDNTFLLQANAEFLPFSDSIFDLVINVNLIDRVINPENTLKNMVSVLKSGGKFIFTSPLNWSNSNLWDKYPCIEDIQKLFENNGLIIDEIFDGLFYREIQDARGSYSDWNTTVVSAIKK
ncbi:class I SAM-dependent methyltransferase [Candidatus Parabeggiatoa sp. HSG14]|uniref:class I SAM-dependent methyltransferase n=1 Tax=Candidatus Parabeggiatoa sp. HSG14 TaxID=3055593 RepID=UPI0025A8E4FC|nr:class I SAM-dependent methyltransferase [Thiotrichales bacterium HSG14]